VVVIDSTHEMVALSVINQPIGVVVELNTIAKIHKYKRFHEGHHFILMVMEVHGAPMHDMDHFIRNVPIVSTIDDWEVIYPYLFAFSFSSNVLISLFNVL
jgi:hypothetical protein